mgnify:FL=1
MAVDRDVTKKSRRLVNSAGPDFALEFLVPSRLMSPGPPSMGLVLLFLPGYCFFLERNSKALFYQITTFEAVLSKSCPD